MIEELPIYYDYPSFVVFQGLLHFSSPDQNRNLDESQFIRSVTVCTEFL